MFSHLFTLLCRKPRYTIKKIFQLKFPKVTFRVQKKFLLQKLADLICIQSKLIQTLTPNDVSLSLSDYYGLSCWSPSPRIFACSLMLLNNQVVCKTTQESYTVCDICVSVFLCQRQEFRFDQITVFDFFSRSWSLSLVRSFNILKKNLILYSGL